MQTYRWCLPAALLLLSPPLYAQQPRQDAFPLEVRLRSINDLLAKADYIAALFGQQQTFRGFLQQVPIDQQRGSLLGIDVRRPFGLYGDFSLDVADEGMGVAMVPVADADTLLGFLQNQLGLQLQKKPDGIFVVSLPPGGPIENLFARFHDGYVYIGVRETDLDVKKLVPAKTFFAKDDGALLSLTVRPDRIPTVKRLELLAKLQEQLEKLQEDAQTRDNPVNRAGFLLGGKLVIVPMRVILKEVKELRVSLYVNEKQDYLSLDVTVVPQANAPIAKSFASLGQRTSRAYGITEVRNAVVRGNINLAIADELRPAWDEFVRALVEDLQREARRSGDPHGEKLIQAVVPTLQAGTLDAAMTMTVPNARGHYSALVAIGVKEGKKLDAAFREFVKERPNTPTSGGSVKVDVARVGSFVVHQIENSVPEETAKYLGSRHVWLAISDDLVVLGTGPDMNLLRSSLSNPTGKAPVASLNMSLVGLARLVDESVTPEQINRVVARVFGATGPLGKDMLRLEMTGGQELKLRLSVQGGGIRFLAALAKFGPE